MKKYICIPITIVIYLGLTIFFPQKAYALELNPLNDDSHNIAPTCSAEYQGELYVGSFEAGEADVWRYNAEGDSWTNVSDSVFDSNIQYIDSMVEFNDVLYVSAYNGTTSYEELWFYDGSTWTNLATDYSDSFTVMIVYDGVLYIGAANDRAHVYSYDGTLPFVELTDVTATSPWSDSNQYITSMEVFANTLYVGTYNYDAGGEVWSYDGSTWSSVFTGGLGDSDNVQISAIEEYDGDLYFSTMNYVEGAQIYNLAGIQINTNGFNGDPNSENEDIAALCAFNGKLYAGTADQGGGVQALLLEYDGSSWTQIDTSMFDPYTNTFYFLRAIGPNLYGSVDGVGEIPPVQNFWGVIFEADLSLEFTNPPQTTTRGSQMTFNTQVSNLGPDNSPSQYVEIELPANVNFVSATIDTAGWNCTVSSGTITCNGPGIRFGNHVNILSRVTVNTGLNEIEISGVVNPSGFDPNLNNNNDSFTVAVTGVTSIASSLPDTGISTFSVASLKLGILLLVLGILFNPDPNSTNLSHPPSQKQLLSIIGKDFIKAYPSRNT